MKKIKLSIIMVVKNGLPFIKDALDSYKKQIYRDKELIIVCSPSSDGTEKFLLNLKNKNKYKIFFDNKSKNKFGSLNKGISLAKGHYVGILHSDDIFYSSNVLKDVSKKIKQTNCDFIYGDCVFVNKKNSKIVREWKSGKFYKNKLSSTNLKLPIENSNCKHVYHLFTVYHPKGGLIKKRLNKVKIQTRTIYPYPIHKMKAYSKLIKNKKDLKISEIKSKGIFCLPLYPELKNKEIDKICTAIKKIIKNI